MNTNKVVVGALAGVAIGAIAGILLAPEKGSETRKQIADKSNDYVGEIKSTLDKFLDLLTDKFRSTKNDAEELVDKGKEMYQDVKKDVKNAAQNFKHDGGAVKNAAL